MEASVRETSVVRVHGVDYAFGTGESRKQVLFDNHLELVPGEIVIMTGPSGSGKTTLLTLIGALRSVQLGQVETLGRQLHSMTSRELVEIRREIGFIFQGHNLFESLSAVENVSVALELFVPGPRERRHRAGEILTRLGLGDRLDHKPQALSGGQKQRVAIARALAHRPRLVLADEPTAALDRDSGREAVELLRDLARQDGVTVLMVTHDGRILDVADRIVSMVDGAIASDVAVRETLEKCQFLLKCPLFATHSASALAEFAQKMTLEHFVAGAVLIQQGAPGEKFYVIKNGTVEVRVERDGKREVKAVLGTGHFFGETALLTGEPRSASIVARDPVEVLTLNQADFRAALDRSKSFEDQVRDVLYNRK